jgi:hypothetical protein
MSKQIVRGRWRLGGLLAGAVVLSLVGGSPPARSNSGPIDQPNSTEPRVVVAKCLSEGGLLYSRGNFVAFERVFKDEDLSSRDLLVCVPGLKVEIEPASKAVGLTLWGNLPGLSDSQVLESAVVLHDTRAYDLDVSLVRGRIVLTNKKAKGAAKVWLRAADAGVQLTLAEPGDSLALELYGRWPAGVPFSLKNKPADGPIRLWEAHCLKGKVAIKAGRQEWGMAAPPGASYFYGDSVDGPAPGGPEKRAKLPPWADPKATPPALAKTVAKVVATYKGQFQTHDPEEVAEALWAASLKDKDKDAARATRMMIIYARGAIDDIAGLVGYLEEPKLADVRQTAVVALRHWIGARDGRDEKLYDTLRDELGYTKAEAETIMQMLHSPFDRSQAETYETLITYLKHRKQAVRVLAAWHLYRLTTVGKDVAYDPSAPAAERNKAVEAWKKLIPDGELPKEDKK